MKKLLLVLTSILIFSTLASSATIEIHSLSNQEMIITPIQENPTQEIINNSRILTTDDEGILTINFEFENPFYLEIELNNNEKTTKIFKDLKDEEINIIEIFPSKNNLPDFIITGFAIYTENKNIIIPIYYSLIIFLSLIVALNIIFKKSKSENLVEEAEELLSQEKQKASEREIHDSDKKEIPAEIKFNNNNEIKNKIKKEETEIDEGEVFTKSEEKLESEIKKEIKEEKKITKPIAGQPAPININTGKIENTEKLISDARELE